MQLHGHLIKLDVPREETFVSTRVRHAIKSHIISWVRPDGTFAARKLEAFSDQGAYASHGHSICAKGVGAFPQLYPCDNVELMLIQYSQTNPLPVRCVVTEFHRQCGL